MNKTEGGLLLCLFETVLNESSFKLKACGPTLCLSWQITDFKRNSETITGQCFITVKTTQVMKIDGMI